MIIINKYNIVVCIIGIIIICVISIGVPLLSHYGILIGLVITGIIAGIGISILATRIKSELNKGHVKFSFKLSKRAKYTILIIIGTIILNAFCFYLAAGHGDITLVIYWVTGAVTCFNFMILLAFYEFYIDINY